ncbi:MAG: pilus assembly protein [Dehalococcoidales bacterium]|nr:pilus assembly protein [Dehalococcoidales bacterium]
MSAQGGIQAKQRGQSVVELALLLPILVMLLLGALDLGRAFHYYTAVANATRAGGAYAIEARKLDVDTDAERIAIVEQAVANEIEAQGITVTSVSVNPPDVIVEGDNATVTVTYDFYFLNPLAGPIGEFAGWGDHITFTYSATIRYA